MILELNVPDRMVKVSTDMELGALQAELAGHGLTLPVGWPSESHRPLIHHLDKGAPHALEAQHGPWRDWVLGATFSTPSGRRIRSGGMVTKNVAGFDLHRFLVGAEGTFGRYEEVILRLWPLGSIRKSVVEIRGEAPVLAYRVLATHYSKACEEEEWLARDPASFTIWLGEPPARRRPEDALCWLDRPNAVGAAHVDLFERALALWSGQ